MDDFEASLGSGVIIGGAIHVADVGDANDASMHFGRVLTGLVRELSGVGKTDCKWEGTGFVYNWGDAVRYSMRLHSLLQRQGGQGCSHKHGEDIQVRVNSGSPG